MTPVTVWVVGLPAASFEREGQAERRAARAGEAHAGRAC